MHRLLLDVSSLLYRAHFALSQHIFAPDGRPVGAVHGYLDWTARLIATRRPDQVVHVYDHDWRPVARTKLYPGYKATRPPEPAELTAQFVLLRQVLDLTDMLQAHTPAWEAEDAIGALVRTSDPHDRVQIVSGDRDLIQLVRDPQVRLLYTVRGVSELLELDEASVEAKYGVPPSRYSDFAILRGDPSDELPGVQGVGEKTARALIQAYDSLDELLADAGRNDPKPGPLRGKPALRARLRASVDYLDTMQKLVPVNDETPVAVWSGNRDDTGLEDLARLTALTGPVRRLIAARAATGDP
jgi:5'-3' exonuclease